MWNIFPNDILSLFPNAISSDYSMVEVLGGYGLNRHGWFFPLIDAMEF
jgi:hypothetical protein